MYLVACHYAWWLIALRSDNKNDGIVSSFFLIEFFQNIVNKIWIFLKILLSKWRYPNHWKPTKFLVKLHNLIFFFGLKNSIFQNFALATFGIWHLPPPPSAPWKFDGYAYELRAIKLVEIHIPLYFYKFFELRAKLETPALPQMLRSNFGNWLVKTSTKSSVYGIFSYC